MALAFVQSNSAQEDGSDTTVAVTLTGVTAGRLIVLWVKYETDADNNATVSASDGTSSFTARAVNHHSGADLHGAFLYLLSSVASGSVTYTVTFSEAVSFKRIHVREYSYTGTASFDVDDVTAEGQSDPAVSGAITTTGTDEVVVAGVASYSADTWDTPTIGGVAGGNMLGQTATHAVTFDRILTGIMTTGAGSLGNVNAFQYVFSLIAFKAAASGSSSVSPSVSPSSSESPSVSPSASLSPSASTSPSPSALTIMGRTVLDYD